MIETGLVHVPYEIPQKKKMKKKWMCANRHHHHVSSARISLALSLSRHSSISSIASGRVFKATSRIGTELLYVGLSCSSSLCSSMWRGPLEYITYELVPTLPAVSRMSGSFNFDSFLGGWSVAIQLLLCGGLLPGLLSVPTMNSDFWADSVSLMAYQFSWVI